MYIFKNPIFEEFITYYMDQNQALVDETVKFDQFQLINWKFGAPQLLIDALGNITNEPVLITQYFQQIKDHLVTITEINQDRASRSDSADRTVINLENSKINFR